MSVSTSLRPSIRRPSTFIDRLEPRQLMSVDLSANTVVPKGAYGDGDLFDIDVKLTNRGPGTSTLPNYVAVTLSKDKKLGNADDIAFGGEVFLGAKKGKTATMTYQVHVAATWTAGDYYVITDANPYGSNFEETNTKNDVTVSATREIRIVTDKLADGAVVRGTPKNDVINVQGNFANDVITVNGKSYLYSVAGNLQPLTIVGGKGNDRITVDANSNLPHVIHGNAGNDTITGGSGDDSLTGDAGADRLYGGAGADTIHGGSGADLIDGGSGADHIFGEGGKDKAKKNSQDVFSSVELSL